MQFKRVCYKCGVQEWGGKFYSIKNPHHADYCHFHHIEIESTVGPARTQKKKVVGAFRTLRAYRTWKRKNWKCIDCTANWRLFAGSGKWSKRMWYNSYHCIHTFTSNYEINRSIKERHPNPMQRNYNYQEEKRKLWLQITSDYESLFSMFDKLSPLELDELLVRCLYSFKKEINEEMWVDNCKALLGFNENRNKWETSECIRFVKYCLNCASKAVKYCKLKEELVYNVFKLVYCMDNNKMNEYKVPEMKDPDQVYCNIVHHTLDMLVYIVVTVSEIIVEEDSKELVTYLTQIKSLLLSLYQNERIFEEFRIRALHLYCLFAFYESTRQLNIESVYYFLCDELEFKSKSLKMSVEIVKSWAFIVSVCSPKTKPESNVTLEILIKATYEELPNSARLEYLKALVLITDLYEINFPSISGLKATNVETKKLLENYNAVLHRQWEIEHLSDLAFSPLQSIVASSFSGKIKYSFLSIVLDRPLLETMLLEKSVIQDSLCTVSPFNKAKKGRNMQSRKKHAFKGRNKSRKAKYSGVSELGQFTHCANEPKRDVIDYYEEEIEEENNDQDEKKPTRKLVGAVWKEHESRKLRTQIRSAFNKVDLNSIYEINKLVYDYELPQQKTQRRKYRLLQ